jgi:hypothetical protein
MKRLYNKETDKETDGKTEVGRDIKCCSYYTHTRYVAVFIVRVRATPQPDKQAQNLLKQ